ncbi:glutaredoxin family protein [Hoyosella sp. YIM 151337]|uniref:glutaredoxin family protein n=1 Tax=Hoyosella sp. YIM 151337 TaxID=2992742 RepID=UPI0022357AB6|nr:glutaredoxin family protein [Hoyosella sp. YIM 151337]MCW4354966.1 glutaredoxin family protein [Hoyosella sp. YIM 151337]
MDTSPHQYTSGRDASQAPVVLLTRAGCAACERAQRVLGDLQRTVNFEFAVVDVDDEAEHDPDLRAEYGDRLPVVLLHGVEHSYGDVDVPRLRADLAK